MSEEIHGYRKLRQDVLDSWKQQRTTLFEECFGNMNRRLSRYIDDLNHWEARCNETVLEHLNVHAAVVYIQTHRVIPKHIHTLVQRADIPCAQPLTQKQVCTAVAVLEETYRALHEKNKIAARHYTQARNAFKQARLRNLKRSTQEYRERILYLSQHTARTLVELLEQVCMSATSKVDDETMHAYHIMYLFDCGELTTLSHKEYVRVSQTLSLLEQNGALDEDTVLQYVLALEKLVPQTDQSEVLKLASLLGSKERARAALDSLHGRSLGEYLSLAYAVQDQTDDTYLRTCKDISAQALEQVLHVNPEQCGKNPSLHRWRLFNPSDPCGRRYLQSLAESGTVTVDDHEHWSRSSSRVRGARGLHILDAVAYFLARAFHEQGLPKPQYTYIRGQNALTINEQTQQRVRLLRDQAYSEHRKNTK